MIEKINRRSIEADKHKDLRSSPKMTTNSIGNLENKIHYSRKNITKVTYKDLIQDSKLSFRL